MAERAQKKVGPQRLERAEVIDLAWPDLFAVRDIVKRLHTLGISARALAGVKEWLAQREAAEDHAHRLHLALCGQKHANAASCGWGWQNCPDFLCGHCGSTPDSDGDHSCPCPFRDGECPVHLDTNRGGTGA